MKKRYLRLVRHALKALGNRNLRHHEWWQRASRPIRKRELWIPCRDSVAMGMAIGLFFSMMLMPFQMIPTALIAMKRGGNVPIAMASCWVSNPLTLPIILLIQVKLGQ
ncbi:MAG: DUF2062 domain-containing protein, partial [Verrucomicrobiales bacterium]